MSEFNIEIINPQNNTIEIENSLNDNITSLDIILTDSTTLEIVNTEKILPSDFPNTYPFSSIIGDVPYTRVSGLTENTQDIIGSSLSGINGINISYNDNSGLTTISLNDPVINTIDIVDFNSGVSGLLSVKGLIASSGISIVNNSGYHSISVTGQFGLTGEQVDDRVAGLLVAGNGIALNYNDIGDNLTISSTLTSILEAQSLVTTVFNRSQTPIPKMTVVYINGGQGDMPTVAYSIASGESSSSKTYGVTQEIIPAMGSGHVVVDGYIGELNTDQFNPTAPQGDVNGVTLWLSPTVSGAMTTSKPYAPYHMVAVGKIIRTHQNQGIINVKIQNGYELEELHNVATTGATNGQFLQYNSSNSLWVPSSNGNFSSLQLNGNTVSVSGHTHTSSNIIDFNSSVSGLIPNNIVYTSGDQNINGNLIVSGSGTFDTLTAIGYPIENSIWGEKLAGIINANTLILDRYTAPGPQDGPAGSIRFITQAPSVVTLKPSDYDNTGGTYLFPQFGGGTLSIEGHTHLTSDITDFNSSVSGLLPITNLTAGSGIGITQSGTTFTVATTGTFGLTQSQVDTRVNALTSGVYAPLSSPSFSGIPLVPTAASGTNTQQIASTAFVRTEISNLVASAPSTLDTLNELATALGNDPNFATTVTNTLAGKANLSGATFTGSVSGPSGNFTSLKVNSIDVSQSGHAHSSSDITNFNSSVSGLLTPYQLALTNPVTGVGTSGYLTKWISSSGISGGGIFDNGTNIGIGTTIPIAPLHIANSLTGSAANSGVLINTTHLPTSNGQSISSLNISPTFSNIYSNISNAYALLISPVSSGQFTTTNSYGLYVNAANILNGSVTSNYAAVFMSGNVGIGTASPSARLEVAASTTTSVDIAHFSNSNGVEKAKFSLSSNGDGTLSLIDGNNVTNAFLSSNSTSSSYVNGKFGIGTSTPSSQLHVVGSGNINGLLQGNTIGTTGVIISNSHASQSANGQNHTSLYVNPTFLTNSSNLGNTYGLLISPSHSGIYATTNSYGLYVNASTLVSGTLYNNYAATFMGGNVGIGTSSPSARLHATIADGNSVLLLNRSTTLAGISLDFTSGFSNLRSYYGLKIFTGSTTANAGTERVHFTDTGLVGVGTSTPSGQLHVIGTGLFSTKLGVGISGFPTWTSFGGTPHTFVHIYGQSGLFPDVNERAFGSLLRLNSEASTTNPRIDFRIGGPGNYDNHFFISRNGTDVIGVDDVNKMFLPNGFTILNPTNNGEGTNASIRSYNDPSSFMTFDNNTRSMIIGYRGKGANDQYIDVASSGRLKIYNYYSEVATFDNRGRFGIGTSTPSGQLHVIGSGIFSSGIRVGDSATNSFIYGPSSNANIQFNNSATNRIDVTATNLYLNGNTNISGTLNISGIPLSETIDDRVASLIVGGTGVNVTYDDTNNTLTLTSENYYGANRGTINVSSPTSTFNVPGGYTIGGFDLFLNGVKLVNGLDFTATNGFSFSTTIPISSGNILEYISLTLANPLHIASDQYSAQISRDIISVTGSLSTITVNGGYDVGGLDVYKDGLKLIRNINYTANNGSTINLTPPASSGSIIEYVSFIAGKARRNLNKITTNTVAGSIPQTDYIYVAIQPLTVTLPSASGNNNRYTIKNSSNGFINVVAISGQTIDNQSNISITTKYNSIDIVSDNDNWIII